MLTIDRTNDTSSADIRVSAPGELSLNDSSISVGNVGCEDIISKVQLDQSLNTNLDSKCNGYQNLKSPLKKAYLYVSENRYAGDWAKNSSNPRQEADSICSSMTELVSALGCDSNNIKAVISTSYNDEIRNLATNSTIPSEYPVYGRNNLMINSSINDLLNFNFNVKLNDAGISSNSDYIWTGSNVDGSFADDNCLNWTSISSNGNPFYGNGYDIGNTDNDNQRLACYEDNHILCLCWEN